MKLTTPLMQQTLSEEAQEHYDSLLESGLDGPSMLYFIREYSEDDFLQYYEEYVRCGEKIGYVAVDAICHHDFAHIWECDERLIGEYTDFQEFAEEKIVEETRGTLPGWAIIDWVDTIDSLKSFYLGVEWDGDFFIFQYD